MNFEWLSDHLWKVLVGLLTFLGWRQVARIDALEKALGQTMTRAEIAAQLEKMDDRREMARIEHSKQREAILAEMQQINMSITAITNQLKGKGVLNGGN